MGRKSLYETNIKPRLKEIEKWRKIGATVEKMCEALGVSKSTFFKFLNEKEEFADAYKKGTFELVCDLRGELARIAFKHTLETKKQYIKQDEDGARVQYTEITSREVDGDIAAINLLLKNLDRDNWSNDPAHVALREAELKLKAEVAKANNFDLDFDFEPFKKKE